nr:hypothetical protein [uncultured bacterium]
MRWGFGVLGGALAAACIASTLASAEPAPGGAFDANYPRSEVYVGAPHADEQPAGRACLAARAYVDTVYAGRFADMAGLFADDAVIYWPMRDDEGAIFVRRIEGRAEIDAFYRNVIGRTRPYAIPVTLLGDDADCMMEVAARTEIDGAQRYRLSAINHFTVDASGKVTRLISFQRSGLSEQQVQ